MKKIFIALFFVISIALAASQYWVVAEVFSQIG